MIVDVLGMDTGRNQCTIYAHLVVINFIKLGETPFLWDYNLETNNCNMYIKCLYLLPAWKLELGPPECFQAWSLVVIFWADWHDWLTNVHTSHSSLWFAKSSSHTSLQPNTTKYFYNIKSQNNNFFWYYHLAQEIQNIHYSYLSAPAHDNILLIRSTWKGWRRIRMWNWSLPQFFTMYLLAQIRAASKASDDNCSYSSDIMWIHNGKLSTGVFLAPRS